jgi:hypothetical protein
MAQRIGVQEERWGERLAGSFDRASTPRFARSVTTTVTEASLEAVGVGS